LLLQAGCAKQALDGIQPLVVGSSLRISERGGLRGRGRCWRDLQGALSHARHCCIHSYIAHVPFRHPCPVAARKLCAMLDGCPLPAPLSSTHHKGVRACASDLPSKQVAQHGALSRAHVWQRPLLARGSIKGTVTKVCLHCPHPLWPACCRCCTCSQPAPSVCLPLSD